MRKRDRTGLAMGPVFLRLALAVTFLWAGLGKFVAYDEVPEADAAILANYGLLPNHRAPRVVPEGSEEAPDGETPAEDPAAPEDSGLGDGQALGGAAFVLTGWQGEQSGLATAADFKEPVEVRRWKGLVLTLHKAIEPGLSDEDSTPLMPLWFDMDPKTDYDAWPRYAAMAVAVTEVVAGVLLVLGLLTRLSAASLAVVMLGAIWLTTVGPAIQSGNTVLGFLPDYPSFGFEWITPLMQFVLLCVSVSLFFSGPGTLSLDRLLLGGPPKPAASKPAPQPKKQ